MKALFVDLLFGSFEVEEKATKTINAVTPALYVFGIAWMVPQLIHPDGTTEGLLAGIVLLVASVLVQWRKSRIAAAAVLVCFLYAPFSFDAIPADRGERILMILFYLMFLICVILACRGAWAFQRIRKEEQRQVAELLAAQGPRVEPSPPRPKGFKAHLDSEKKIKDEKADDEGR